KVRTKVASTLILVLTFHLSLLLFTFFTPVPSPLAGSRRSVSNTVAAIPLSLPKSLSEGSLALQQTDRHAPRACAGMARPAPAGETSVLIVCLEVCATAPCLPRSALRSSLPALPRGR